MPKINSALQQVDRSMLSYQSTEKIRLHASERDVAFENKMWCEFVESLNNTDVRFYPNILRAYDVLQQLTGIDKAFLTLCDGSDTCIRNIFLSFAPKNTNIVTAYPAFPMYEIYGNMFGCDITSVPYTTEHFPFDNFIAAINNDTSIVILSNPISPIGDTLSNHQILQLLFRCKETNSLLVVDEAYIEFSNVLSSEQLAMFNDNIIVVRTLSKAYGSAGIRVGYIISSESNKKILYKVKANNEVTSVAIKWLEILYKFKSESESYIKNVVTNRNDLILKLQNQNKKVISSQTNFIHVKDCKLTDEFVTKEFVMPWSGETYIRLSIPGNEVSYHKLRNILLT